MQPKIILLFSLIMLFQSNGNTVDDKNNYPPPECIKAAFAGTWYPGNKAELTTEIKKYIENVKEKQVENVIGLILPHAGYSCSGQTAAYGIKQIIGKDYKRVIIIGPAHRYYMSNRVAVPTVRNFSTPLGKTAIDTEFINKFSKLSFVTENSMIFASENSIEIQIPFLQYALKNFKLVPIAVGRIDKNHTKKIAQAILTLVDDKTLVVASGDFTHYGPGYRYVPFKNNIADNLKKLDLGLFKYMEKKDIDGYFNYINKTGITVCGRGSFAILLEMLSANSDIKLLNYDTSGRIFGNYTNSVSYISAVCSGKWKKISQKNSPVDKKSDSCLSVEDKKKLLKLARETLKFYIKHKKIPTPDDLGIKISPAMKKVMGAFVTLHKNGRLRGCIGEISPRRALYKAVMAHAVNSGLNDYRFRPVKESEIPNLEFEISALTPPVPVKSYKDIVIGKHGMTLRKHGRSAVYLPQVAPEQGWDLATTLSHLSRKAGLPANAWKNDTMFTVFEAIVFNEKDLKHSTP